jgi:predicted transposase YbfD/YdcC
VPVSLIESFSVLPDPRKHHNKIRHKLLDVVVMTVCAVISGADDWIEIVNYANSKRRWLESFLELPGGIPSHDTFARLFSMINAERFGECFLEWVSSVAQRADGRVVPIDGKTLRRSHNGDRNSALHVVSAFCAENRLVLGQVATQEKSNEITAIPELLEVLDVLGAIVTIDAMGCQKDIVSKIISKGGDYTIGLKGNQPKLLKAVEEHFKDVHLDTEATDDLDVHFIEEKSHGRERIQATFASGDLTGIEQVGDWAGLQSVAMVITDTMDKGRWKTERRYYLSSLEQNADQVAHAVREHWSIENSVHWVLDVAFREDDSRVRRENGAQNLAVMRHAALNLLRQDKVTKSGVKNKRKKAGWDNDYLASLLFGD